MSEIIGETRQLTAHSVRFHVAYKLVGKSGSISFNLAEQKGIAAYIAPYAKVEIVGPLSCEVLAPASADKATVATVAAIPEGFLEVPTHTWEIITISGAVQVSSSVYKSSEDRVLSFPAEVTSILKPKVLLGEKPRIVGSFDSPGATDSTVSVLVLKGTLELSGVGFIKTW